MDDLREMSKCLDQILDLPADQWTSRQINLYHLIQNTIEKYRIRYSLAQFKLDIRDIRRNIKSQNWYEKSRFRKTIDWCLEQLQIKSFQKSKASSDFKVTCRFAQVQAQLVILYKDETFYMELKSPLLETDLKDLDSVAKVFGIDEKIEDKNRKEVALDIVKIMEEIAMFYAG